jgi:pimeloyl-ACP methyl ester carboxylesterase
VNAYRERAVMFGRTGGLLGIWSEPKGGATGIPVIVLGAGILHRIGPSRVAVHLARLLASRGHPVLRFDLSGIGDSGRPAEPSLEAAVTADIRDAVDHACARDKDGKWAGRIAFVGFCSGADNALHAGSDDPRVHAAVLFDPTVHRTRGFYARELAHSLTSVRAWTNFLTGRSLKARYERWRGRTDPLRRPPGYYGLLVASPEETDRRARVFREHGGRMRFVLSSGVKHYCNAPEQVREALPTAFAADRFEVVWAPHLDHVFGTRAQVDWFVKDSAEWLGGLQP